MTDKEEREVLRRYLRQYLSAKRRKCDLERRRAQLQQDMQCPLGAVRYDGMPRSGSPSEGAAAFAYRIDEVEQRIRAQQDEMARAALEIMDIIDFLEPGSLEREVIEKRYMDGMAGTPSSAIFRSAAVRAACTKPAPLMPCGRTQR